MLSMYFCWLVGSSIYFLRDAKYVSTIFLSWQWMIKIYVKWNLCKSSIMYVRELLYVAYVCPYTLHMYVLIYCICISLYIAYVCPYTLHMYEPIHISHICPCILIVPFWFHHFGSSYLLTEAAKFEIQVEF
jgi:hypothetical protein